MASLLFNHALLEGVAHRPVADTAAAVGEVMGVLRRARRTWPNAALFVHDDLWRVPAEPDTPFRTWASRNAGRPELRDLVQNLLRACDAGPYLSGLPVDDLGPPDDIEPWPAEASSSVVEVVERGLHHRLAFPGALAWVLSIGSDALPDAEYRGPRGVAEARLANLLTPMAAGDALTEAVTGELATRRAVLDRVAKGCPRVRFLDRVAKGIDRALVDVPLPKLYAALAGLEAYALAIEEERSPKHAYEAETGIEVSDESTTVHSNPNLRRQLEFQVPGEAAKAVFGYHAKVGYSTRIHFVYRQRTVDTDDGPRTECTVWVGRIDEHPRGARG